MRFDREFRPATEEDVLDLERRLGRELPREYRGFLLQHNGGKPHSRVFDMPMLNDVDEIGYLYGINVSQYYDLSYMLEIYQGRIPDTLLPVADDPGGNQICISLGKDDLGAIYFWDHELEFEGSAATRIADSFDAFVGSLREGM